MLVITRCLCLLDACAYSMIVLMSTQRVSNCSQGDFSNEDHLEDTNILFAFKYLAFRQLSVLFVSLEIISYRLETSIRRSGSQTHKFSQPKIVFQAELDFSIYHKQSQHDSIVSRKCFPSTFCLCNSFFPFWSSSSHGKTCIN